MRATRSAQLALPRSEPARTSGASASASPAWTAHPDQTERPPSPDPSAAAFRPRRGRGSPRTAFPSTPSDRAAPPRRRPRLVLRGVLLDPGRSDRRPACPIQWDRHRASPAGGTATALGTSLRPASDRPARTATRGDRSRLPGHRWNRPSRTAATPGVGRSRAATRSYRASGPTARSGRTVQGGTRGSGRPAARIPAPVGPPPGIPVPVGPPPGARVPVGPPPGIPVPVGPPPGRAPADHRPAPRASRTTARHTRAGSGRAPWVHPVHERRSDHLPERRLASPGAPRRWFGRPERPARPDRPWAAATSAR